MPSPGITAILYVRSMTAKLRRPAAVNPPRCGPIDMRARISVGDPAGLVQRPARPRRHAAAQRARLPGAIQRVVQPPVRVAVAQAGDEHGRLGAARLADHRRASRPSPPARRPARSSPRMGSRPARPSGRARACRAPAAGQRLGRARRRCGAWWSRARSRRRPRPCARPAAQPVGRRRRASRRRPPPPASSVISGRGRCDSRPAHDTRACDSASGDSRCGSPSTGSTLAPTGGRRWRGTTSRSNSRPAPARPAAMHDPGAEAVAQPQRHRLRPGLAEIASAGPRGAENGQPGAQQPAQRAAAGTARPAAPASATPAARADAAPRAVRRCRSPGPMRRPKGRPAPRPARCRRVDMRPARPWRSIAGSRMRHPPSVASGMDASHRRSRYPAALHEKGPPCRCSTRPIGTATRR